MLSRSICAFCAAITAVVFLQGNTEARDNPKYRGIESPVREAPIDNPKAKPKYERPTRSAEDDYKATSVLLHRWNPNISRLIGPDSQTLRRSPGAEKCDDVAGPGGDFSCRVFYSSDGTRWKIANGSKNGERQHHILKFSSNAWRMHASITVVDYGNGDIIVAHTDEARAYAAMTNSSPSQNAKAGQPNSNPIQDAAKELERALGTAVPGRPLPPLKLPSFGR